MLHFAQAGIALVVAGASVLIIGALVRESLRGGGQQLHLFPEADEHPELPVAKPVEKAMTRDAGPFPHSRGNDAGRSKTNAKGKDRTARKQRKEKRRSKERNGTEDRTGIGSLGTAVEAEDA